MRLQLITLLTSTGIAFLRVIIACLILFTPQSVAAYNKVSNDILIFYSGKSQFHKRLADELRLNLKINFPDSHISFINDDTTKHIKPDDLIISMGVIPEIDNRLRTLNNSIIYINDTKKPAVISGNKKSYINIEITQPVCRNLYLINALNPKWSDIGYITSTPDDTRLNALRICAKDLGIILNIKQIQNSSDLPAIIDDIVKNNDVILALPDNLAYNRNSVKNILLTAYRQRVPVIGFSDNFVNAGALAAVHYSTTHIAEQVIISVNSIYKSDSRIINTSIYPDGFSVSTNKQVAISLSIELPSETTLHRSILRMGSGL